MLNSKTAELYLSFC